VSTRAPASSRVAWEKRLASIQAAHAEFGPGLDPSDPGFSWTPLEPSEAGVAAGAAERVGPCVTDGSRERLLAEVAGMIEGCRELAVDVAPDASLVARVVGAPDVGMLVESVELVGRVHAPDALRECLVESMYTLDLGASEQSCAQTVTLMMGGNAKATLEGMRGAALDDATRAAVDAAIAGSGERGPRMMFVTDGEPPSAE
jgi:hypothetical protein